MIEKEQDKALSFGLQIAKVWGPILAVGIGFGIGYATINTKLATVEARVTTIEEARQQNLPQFNTIVAQFPGTRQDVAWLKANMIQILIKQGIQPIDPPLSK